jgi:Holliday junction resolvase RusA-like endonuclease
MNEWLSDAILPEPVAVPVQCEVEFVCKKPKAPVNTFPVGDIDNYLKAVWDSLQGRGFFKDDKQIEDVIASKRYVNPGETPHIQIEFKES